MLVYLLTGAALLYLSLQLNVGFSLDSCLCWAFLKKSLDIVLLHPSLHAPLKMNNVFSRLLYRYG